MMLFLSRRSKKARIVLKWAVGSGSQDLSVEVGRHLRQTFDLVGLTKFTNQPGEIQCAILWTRLGESYANGRFSCGHHTSTSWVDNQLNIGKSIDPWDSSEPHRPDCLERSRREESRVA